MSENKHTTNRKSPNGFYKGWFLECIDSMCPGQAFGLKISKEGGVLKEVESLHQQIMVLKTETFGNVLLLDGVVNCTERDEFCYQEMITHLALCSHPDPINVLIIGGGDGGVAREVAKHKAVQRIDQCEIDGEVVEVCKEFLPQMSCGYKDEKVNLVIGDGFQFMQEHSNHYDIIITDSSDPSGPAEGLFGEDYYKLLFKALKQDGIIISQGESLWIAPTELGEMMKMVAGVFPVVAYAHTLMPSYTTGQIGFILASKNIKTNFKEPKKILNEDETSQMDLKYYNHHIHRSSFVFPRFMQRIINTSISRK